ncbi:hypothetical protein HQQ81_18490 [Microbacteriaceae bacterium VKM Ac-2854]|nr:hypothetical protein [Microbacteriaceae bacterium VKM Ac-2854]
MTADSGASDIDAIVAKIAAAPEQEVIVVSHGWNADADDAPALYNKWLTPVANVLTERGLPHPLIVAVHWPSKAWGNEVGVTLGGAVLGGPQEGVLLPIDEAVASYCALLGETAEQRDALIEPLTSVLRQSALGADPAGLAPDVLQNLLDIRDIVASDGSDEELWDPELAYEQLAEFSEAEAGVAGTVVDSATLGGAGSWRLMGLVRQASFWKMKKRARVVGSSGVHHMLAAFQRAAGTTRGTRLHLVGHSFGCIVVCAAVMGEQLGGARNPVRTLTLIQGAMSMWTLDLEVEVADGASGYFSPLLDEGLVSGPILVTRSTSDHAVGTYYPIASRITGAVLLGPDGKYGATGAHGAVGLEPEAWQELVLNPGDTEFDLTAGQLYNVDASAVISIEAPVEGSHNDIAKTEIAALIIAAMAAPVSP